MHPILRLMRVLALPWVGCSVVWGGSFVGALTVHLSGSDDYSWLVRAAILGGGILFPLVALLIRRPALRTGNDPRLVAVALLLFALTPLPIVLQMGFA